MDAVREGYLKNMYFGIAQDAAATHLLEVIQLTGYLGLLCALIVASVHSTAWALLQRSATSTACWAAMQLCCSPYAKAPLCAAFTPAASTRWHPVSILQEYIYSFKYGEDGVTFEVNTKSHGKTKDKYSSANTKVSALPGFLYRHAGTRQLVFLVHTASCRGCFGSSIACMPGRTNTAACNLQALTLHKLSTSGLTVIWVPALLCRVCGFCYPSVGAAAEAASQC